ncbi:uncharacterized protein LOC119163682 [Rhipicephalus microplus]|uniref:uncharacterized protein LOC119163682 n=1 Tax=Rhipicephalus microplus TaxID=6941 RepID=UPI003F6C841D
MVLLVCFIVQVGFAADTNANEASGDKYAPNRNSVAIGKRATCPFTRVLNIVSGRVPPEIPTVKCKCPGNRCSSVGDFRCLEVREKLTVFYPNWKDGSRWSVRNKTIVVTTACVCAMSRAVKSHDLDDRIFKLGLMTDCVDDERLR